MGFASGSVSFRRFVVIGKHPKSIDQKILDTLESHVLQVPEVGLPEEVEYGWCGGRHVFDSTFTFEHNVFAEAIHFALRIDTNRVPGAIKKAYTLLEEEAVAKKNPSGHISKAQKKDVNDSVRAMLEEDLKTGKYRRSKLLPVLWDFSTHTLYSPASGQSAEKLRELFERSFGLELMELSAGNLALRHLEQVGKRRDYEDFRPTRFAQGPEGEGQQAEYPWTAKGPQPKDFLGNEFMLWLWYHAEKDGSSLPSEAGDVGLVIDKTLDLDCAYGMTGRDMLKGDGPTRMPEARDALRSGKVPRKAALLLEAAGKGFEFTLAAESLAIGAGKLPDVEEASDARVMFEERVAMLRDFIGAIDGLFFAFLKTRASSSWEGQTNSIRRWIMQSAKAGAAA